MSTFSQFRTSKTSITSSTVPCELLIVGGGGTTPNTTSATGTCCGGSGGGQIKHWLFVSIPTGISYTVTIGAANNGSSFGTATAGAGYPGATDSLLAGSSLFNVVDRGSGGGGSMTGSSSGTGKDFANRSGSNLGQKIPGGNNTLITNSNSLAGRGYASFATKGGTFYRDQAWDVRASGGGGGAGGDGIDGAASTGGAGGPGLILGITGANVAYAAGGAGLTALNTANGANGAANTGNGGGGGAANTTGTGVGGTGGSGVVILAYPDTYGVPSSITGTYNTPTRTGYRVYRFTGSGSITL